MENTKKRLVDIFGAANVIDDPAALDSFAKSEGFVKGLRPQLIVRAANTAQIEELMNWANETKTPVIPVSSGGRHRKGGTVPAAPGAIILDLSGMKKIFSANTMFRIATFEAGVTYGELAPELEKYGLMIDTSLAPRAEKSVLASVLETEPRLNPNMQWVSSDPLRCTETVWGDGKMMRTGEIAAVPNSVPAEEAIKSAQASESWQILPNGPDSIDYFRLLTGAQGTLGVVSWASMKCALKPDQHDMYLVPAECAEKVIDFMYAAEHLRFGDSLFVLNAFALASLIGETPEEIDAIRGKLPAYVCCTSVAGRPPLPEKRVYAHKVGLEGAAQKLGLRMLPTVGGVSGKAVFEKAFKPCAPGKYWKDTYTGSSAEIFFLTTMDKAPAYIAKMYEIAERENYDTSMLGVYIQPKHQGVNCHVEFILPYCPDCEAKVKDLFDKASQELSSMGAYYSRPYGKWARLQLNKDAMAKETLKKIKGILDPNEILNPGKLSSY